MEMDMTQTVYFAMMNGLRGCYMPDSSYIHKADSFREFCNIIRYETEFGEYKPVGQTRFAWQHLKSGKPMEVCVAVSTESDSYGLTVSSATEQDYNEQSDETV